VEEAARVIRVGRTKAYAMAREWRDSGGRSGLPVVDFGHVLRVPRRALEQLVGATLTGLIAPEVDAERSRAPEPSASNVVELVPTASKAAADANATPLAPTARPSRSRRRRPVDPASQPSLPFTG
jgi:hypothetical protein